jgi:nucleotide-binding universal stress UspA family protein
MIPPRSLLVATDFSAGAERAADVALDLAARWGARIDWLHAAPEASHVLTPSSDALVSQYVEHERSEADAALRKLEARSRERGVDCALHLASGRPDLEVDRCAAEAGSDWIVVGTHGRSGIQSLWLGSVAEKIVRSSAVPVLCVRSGPPLVEGGIVVYGEDFGSSERRQVAAGVAKSLDAHLVAVHAIELVGTLMVDSGFSPGPGLIDACSQEARERLNELSGEYGKDSETEVCIGLAAGAMCDLARRRNSGLIVTGSASRRGLERWMLGSVAEKTLRHAPCSVLVLK